jgi:hypothetical protein
MVSGRNFEDLGMPLWVAFFFFPAFACFCVSVPQLALAGDRLYNWGWGG